jgi:hypothetical protein
MPEVSPTGNGVALGALLVLLHGAADPFRTVQVTYRTWRHEQRLLEAFRADIEEQKRRGASVSSVTAFRRSGDPAPAETEETVRVWRDGRVSTASSALRRDDVEARVRRVERTQQRLQRRLVAGQLEPR